MWFATSSHGRGGHCPGGGRRNPLTGLSGLQLKWEEELGIPTGAESQSPYGAKWFATIATTLEEATSKTPSRNPLTGLSGLQLGLEEPGGGLWYLVAIPLRG